MNTLARKAIVFITTLFISATFGAGIANASTTITPTNTLGSSSSLKYSADTENTQVKEYLLEGIQTLFEEILYLGNDGRWHQRTAVNVTQYGLTQNQVEDYVSALDALEALSRDKSPGSFAKCVFWEAFPFASVVTIDWGRLYSYIKHRSWEKVIGYVAKHVSKSAAKQILKANPVGLAGSLAVGAAKCAWRGA